MTGPAPPRLLVATTNRGKLAEIRDILAETPTTLATLDDHPGIGEPEETGTTFAANARLKALYYAEATGELTVAEDSGLEIDALDGEPGVRSARFNGESYAEKFAAIRRMLAERGADRSAARFVCALALARPSSPDGSAGRPTNPAGVRTVPRRELLARPSSPDGSAGRPTNPAGVRTVPRRGHLARPSSPDGAAGRPTDPAGARAAAVLWEAAGVVEGRVQLPPRGEGGFGYDPIFHYPPYGRTLAEVSPEEKAAVSHRGQAFRQLRRHLTAGEAARW